MIIKSTSLDRVARKADRSISLHFTTALEQTSDQLKELDENLGSCIIAIKPNESEFEFADLNKLDSVDIAIPEKSQAKRMKDTIWRLQESQLKRKPTKEEEKEFYRIKTNQVIEHFKNQIEL